MHWDTGGHFEELVSATGTRQEDPIGGALFALAHQQALRATALAFPFAADNSHVVGPPRRVVEAFNFSERALLSPSPHVQRAKCVAWCPFGAAAFGQLPNRCTYVVEGILVLGAPFVSGGGRLYLREVRVGGGYEGSRYVTEFG